MTNYLNDDDSHDAWQQQQEEFRRMAEDEAARYRAAHPLWDKCLKHPDRQRDGNEPYCAECRENHVRNYADRMIERDRWGPQGEPDNKMVGGDLYTRGTGGYYVPAGNTQPKGLK